jgi:hypothetical protein
MKFVCRHTSTQSNFGTRNEMSGQFHAEAVLQKLNDHFVISQLIWLPIKRPGINCYHPSLCTGSKEWVKILSRITLHYEHYNYSWRNKIRVGDWIHVAQTRFLWLLIVHFEMSLLTFICPFIVSISLKYNQQDASFLDLFISINCSTCFRRFLRPSSGA